MYEVEIIDEGGHYFPLGTRCFVDSLESSLIRGTTEHPVRMRGNDGSYTNSQLLFRRTFKVVKQESETKGFAKWVKNNG